MTNNRPIEIGTSALQEKSCISDAIKLWNLVPEEVKRSNYIHAIKTLTKQYMKTLPI